VYEVVEAARFNAFDLRIAVLCGILIFFDGFDLTAISCAAPAFIKLLDITRPMIAPVFFSGLLGLIIGAKRTVLFCDVLFGLFSIATPLSD
jgi:MFS transporter, AAHS family, 4-hydroxybenzoate transporter